MALLNYRSQSELNERFGRSWQSGVSPLGHHGRFAVESYLDFHGNRFTRRFDANSYIRLVDAMSSHDIGRGRDGIEAALGAFTGPALVLGIDSDRLYPVAGPAADRAAPRGRARRPRADPAGVPLRPRRLPHRARGGRIAALRRLLEA